MTVASKVRPNKRAEVIREDSESSNEIREEGDISTVVVEGMDVEEKDTGE